ncbi:unnamed protein product [Moneuplotes crassus]|uniref:Uncharacterized protein n=1 Tax=Euplotes crassus TaxID=5936 RepID=A0AAD1Y9S4_EUPCR|nr:unnamed protein product [Moneuplotes crassus]
MIIIISETWIVIFTKFLNTLVNLSPSFISLSDLSSLYCQNPLKILSEVFSKITFLCKSVFYCKSTILNAFAIMEQIIICGWNPIMFEYVMSPQITKSCLYMIV